ncbi:unnamed protein product [Gordionus sp. m RMFG-2023]
MPINKIRTCKAIIGFDYDKALEQAEWNWGRTGQDKSSCSKIQSITSPAETIMAPKTKSRKSRWAITSRDRVD